MLPRLNQIPTLLAILTFALALEPMARPQGKPPLRRARLNVVASRNSVSAINFADVQAAGTVWVQTLGRRRGFQLDARFEIADGPESLRKQVEDFSADLVILDVIEYLKLAPSGLLQPFVAIAHGKTGMAQNNHLIANRDSGIASLADLRGKKIIFYSRADLDLSAIWVETLLNEQRLGRSERFFGSITHVAKPSSACLPVFFQKLDACVVDGASWDVLTEMNPQMASKLRILDTSPAYLEGLLCVHAKHKDFRDELLRSLLDLDKDPEGRQLLTIFRGDRVMAVKDQDAASARELWTKYMISNAPPAPAATRVGVQVRARP